MIRAGPYSGSNLVVGFSSPVDSMMHNDFCLWLAKVGTNDKYNPTILHLSHWP
jgi:hypothetical protein